MRMLQGIIYLLAVVAVLFVGIPLGIVWIANSHILAWVPVEVWIALMIVIAVGGRIAAVRTR
jgi:hypothetical protein